MYITNPVSVGVDYSHGLQFACNMQLGRGESRYISSFSHTLCVSKSSSSAEPKFSRTANLIFNDVRRFFGRLSTRNGIKTCSLTKPGPPRLNRNPPVSERRMSICLCISSIAALMNLSRVVDCLQQQLAHVCTSDLYTSCSSQIINDKAINAVARIVVHSAIVNLALVGTSSSIAGRAE